MSHNSARSFSNLKILAAFGQSRIPRRIRPAPAQETGIITPDLVPSQSTVIDLETRVHNHPAGTHRPSRHQHRSLTCNMHCEWIQLTFLTHKFMQTSSITCSNMAYMML